jgi:hypothetical protein
VDGCGAVADVHSPFRFSPQSWLGGRPYSGSKGAHNLVLVSSGVNASSLN